MYTQNQALEKVIDTEFHQNRYFSHEEKLLLFMLGAERKLRHNIAYRRIIRKGSDKTWTFGNFKLAVFNFNAYWPYLLMTLNCLANRKLLKTNLVLDEYKINLLLSKNV